MKMNKKDWIIQVNVVQKIYSKYLNNLEFFIIIKYINNIKKDFLSLPILTSI